MLLASQLLVSVPAASGANWRAVDSRVKAGVYQVNVAITVKLKGNKYAQLAGLSPRNHYPVFATTDDDKGFRVVGHGSCFPVQTIRTDGTYLLTNKHVVDFGEGMLQECQRFYAGMRLHAQRTSGFLDAEARYKDLMRVANLALNKKLSATEKAMNQATIDSIWDTYDHHLSKQADPQRKQFQKYLAMTGFRGTVGYFVHRPGSSSNAALSADLYRKAQSDLQPDLAVLIIKGKPLPSLALKYSTPRLGEVVQAVGYPAIKQSGVTKPINYAPTFTTGKVRRAVPQFVHFEAPVSQGDSGGPLIDEEGYVIGVVVKRALNEGQMALNDYASAVSVPAVVQFAPELFKTAAPRQQR